MAGEDQERFEDYLELERYIEELQAGLPAQLPRDLTPEQARVYRMAALFRSASPEAATPNPEFADSLQALLLAMSERQGQGLRPPASIGTQEPISPTPSDPQEAPAPIEQEAQQEPMEAPRSSRLPHSQAERKRVSRRAILTGSAVAAASLVVGTGVGVSMGQHANDKAVSVTPPANKQSYPDVKMVPAEVPADWHFVTTLAQLGKEAVFFVADTIVGYVLRNDDDDDANSEGPAAPKEPVVALSAACTHMGCIVQWHDNDRHFHCPCHGGLFTEYGQPANKQGGLQYLKALPSLDVRVVDGKVYVRVPSAPLK